MVPINTFHSCRAMLLYSCWKDYFKRRRTPLQTVVPWAETMAERHGIVFPLLVGVQDPRRRRSCVCSSQGGTFGKLAILAKDTKALADKVTASGGAKKIGGGDVLFAGEVPGIGTKVQTPTAFLGSRRCSKSPS